ncbi:MAG: hypothetical protein ACOCWO_05555 [Candidatus Muiribacteriaceae bacterium]
MKKEELVTGNMKCSIDDEKDVVYRERNSVVALAAKLALENGLRAGIRRHPKPDSDKSYVVIIHLPTGQVSWHIRECEVEMFDFLEEDDIPWDGHDRKEKYRRLNEYIATQNKT